jgi:hypothetical protein
MSGAGLVTHILEEQADALKQEIGQLRCEEHGDGSSVTVTVVNTHSAGGQLSISGDFCCEEFRDRVKRFSRGE